MAQLVGFSADDAYWIAAYNDLMDYGVFEPHDLQGNVVGGGALRTASFPGLQRMHLSTGGICLHYVTPYGDGAVVPGIDGLHPDAQNPKVEILLAHLRGWAMAGSGTTRPFCTGGLTRKSSNGDYATGDQCYASLTSKAVPIKFRVTLNGPVVLPGETATGYQVLSPKSLGTPESLSPEFDTLVGGGASRISDARIGVYLHVFGDRISHHVCTDKGLFSGPDPGPEGGWSIDLTNDQCAQDTHMLQHIWETGVDFSSLKPQYQTTLASLSTIYDELVAFAQARGVLKSGATDVTRKNAVTGAIAKALQDPSAESRVRGLATLACVYGVSSFPGMPVCSSQKDGGGIAGDRSIADGGAPDAATKDSASSDRSPPAPSSGCSYSASAADFPAGTLFAVSLLSCALFFLRRRWASHSARNPHS
jgi:hypothetical protein